MKQLQSTYYSNKAVTKNVVGLKETDERVFSLLHTEFTLALTWSELLLRCLLTGWVIHVQLERNSEQAHVCFKGKQSENLKVTEWI